MKKEIGISILAATLLGIVCLSAKADLITIAISGQVTTVNDQYNHFGNNIQIGDTITGTYTYDSTILDSELSPESGLYYNTGNLCGISLNVSGFNFKTDPTNVDFLVSAGNYALGGDSYALLSYHNSPLIDTTQVQYINWQLDDSTGTALSSDILPLTAPDLSKWNYNSLFITTDRNFTVIAIITSATLIPEPTIILFIFLGVALIKRN